MAKLNQFSKQVSKKLKYYVYRLVDPRNGQTFYVGKGSGNRVFAHASNALKNYKGEKFSEENDDVSLKTKLIREIKNDGFEVICIIHRHGLTEKEAFEVESALIDCYPGLTNIQSGHNPERGVNNAKTIEKIYSLQEYDDNDDLKYCIIKIKQSSIDANNGDIYETVRKSWRVDLNKIKNYPYVFASCDGVVKEIYKVKWHKSSKISGRCYFDGECTNNNEIRDKYINKRLPSKYVKKGMASPILYSDSQ